MADATWRAACEHVKRRFPELAGVRPTSEQRGDVFVYTFACDIPTSPGGPKVRKVVRVTVDGRGRVVKTVVSR